MQYDAVIVGGGIAGLTSAAYLCKEGYKVLVCEKEKSFGGLVNSFQYKGFTFDGGIRAIENSGIVYPMLRQLGIEVEFIKNHVSIGIAEEVIKLTSKDSLLDFENLLINQFPQDEDDIKKITAEIKKAMQYMDILYGIDNPLFLDLKKDKEYLYKTILPWLFKYITTIQKIVRLNTPIYQYLRNFSQNTVLIDIIAQHFFKDTPAFFALSYFSLYLDYQYPKGGTGCIIRKLEQFILENKGELRNETEICSVNPSLKQVIDSKGNEFFYKKLLWAADLKRLYQIADLSAIKDAEVRMKATAQKVSVSDKIGGDSILTLYLTLDMDKTFFEKIASAHFFYTPNKIGLSSINLRDLEHKETDNDKKRFTSDKQTILDWVKKYYELTTYEISCPVMRDDQLAPEGKTGLIVSTLMEHSLVKHISNLGWYEEFKQVSEECILNCLDASIFTGIKSKVMDRFTSTPLTLERITGNADGAITGWAFTNSSIPVETNLPKVARSVLTPFADVFQAGQWCFSPSGLPISVLTAKLAADKIKKQLK